MSAQPPEGQTQKLGRKSDPRLPFILSQKGSSAFPNSYALPCTLSLLYLTCPPERGLAKMHRSRGFNKQSSRIHTTATA